MDELRSLRTRAGLLTLALLAACADPPEQANYADQLDPIVAQALSDQLVVDPDLVGQNEANAALISAPDGSIPTEIATQAAVRAAREEAGILLAESGGLESVPAPQPLDPVGEEAPLELLSAQVARVPSAAECFDQATYSAVWAARMPSDLPIYPRGGTVEAMGTDADGCSMRAVRFHTPVAIDDVVTFYYGIVSGEGYAPDYLADENQHRIEGAKGAREVAIQIRRSLEGLTQVDLVAAGK